MDRRIKDNEGAAIKVGNTMTSIGVKAGGRRPAPARAGVAGPFVAKDKSAKAVNWIFADKERMFWILQVSSWLGFFFFHIFTVSTLIGGRSAQSISFSFASALIGFLTTSIVMRPIFRFARRQPPVILLTTALATTILMTIAMAAVKAQAFGVFFGNEWMQSRMDILGTQNFFYVLIPDLPVNLFLLMSWAGFYFGINYYLTLRDETQRALLSARLADQAQLKMLRYQLNPHFLFNTLNAISTLVLEKDGKNANGMLTRLSAFLRYSLDSDPLQKTTLSEELRALQLYLDIEKTRFGDRLEVHLDIDDAVQDAMVPSLIMQPAIENAIKNAIAQMESDGKICITAKREGDMLRLQVCDNGPNAPADPNKVLENATTGVGLVNMRDRLAHLYGGRQAFLLSRLEPAGLCVCLKLPLETRSD
ncbi:MAG: histidine kinase [Amphiplicatus sp.]